MLQAADATYAQLQSIDVYPNQPIVQNEASIALTLLQTYVPVDVTFTCLTHKNSPHATYYTFQQVIGDIPVEQVHIKVLVQSEKIVRITGNYYAIQTQDDVTTNTNTDAGTYVYRIQNNHPVLYAKRWINRSASEGFFEYSTPDGQFVFTDNRRTYFMLPDTTVRAMIFLPDPITSAETDYSGTYQDFDDADSEELNNERVEVMMPATFENDTFFLRTEHIVLKDINTPVIPIPFSLTDTFFYTRGEDGFEAVQALYHLTNLSDYLQSIDYDDLTNFYIEVDPHGASGADQSFYVSAEPPSIQYGVGGVDDAEDADVIIHEFVHALSDFAAPESNTGLERRAIDEGFADYFAASYSRSYSEYNWFEIFNWDGHNEYWTGRNANTDKHYPEDNSDNYYDASEIWSGALMDIYDLIGKEPCDKIVCEALYASFANMNMHEAALALIQAENLVYSGLYYDEVFDALYARGLIWPDDILHQVVSSEIQISNSLSFALGTGPLSVQLSQNAKTQWQLFDISGKLIAQGEAEQNIIQIAPITASPGLICLRLDVAGQVFSTRLIIY